MRKSLLTSLVLLLSFLCIEAWAQTVSGTVTDENGEPIPGITVLIKGSTEGVATDVNGNFSIEASSADVLEFSGIGLAPQNVEVGSQTTIDIVMSEGVMTTETVVITAVGIKRSAREISYGVTTVNNEDLVIAQPDNMISGLRGKLTGVQINDVGGQPGQSQSIIIRGAKSFTGSSQPLIVVDGIPISNNQLSDFNGGTGASSFVEYTDAGNGITDLDPESIESITVLKGISAASLYGSAAANGAIIITTKKGSSGGEKFQISYSGGAQFSEVLRIPKVQTTFGLGQLGNNLAFTNDQETWGDPYNGELRPWSQIIDNQQLWKRYDATPQTLREAFDVGYQINNSISVSGSGEKLNYRVGYSRLDQKGIVPSTYRERNVFTLAGSADLNHGISVESSMQFIASESGLTPSGTGGNDEATFYGNLLRVSADIPTNEIRDIDNKFHDIDGFFTPFNSNAFRPAFNWKDIAKGRRVIGNVTLNYKALDWLRFTSRIGGDVERRRLEQFRPIERASLESPNNIDRAGTLRFTDRSSNRINLDVIANINRQLFDGFKINVDLGYNLRDFFSNTISAQQPELGFEGFQSLNNAQTAPSVAEATTQIRQVGAYGRIGLSYKDIYFLEFQGRNDWNSTLPVENQSFFYYSIGGSVILSDVLNVDVIDYLKLRGSYSEVGTGTAPYSVSNTFLTSPNEGGDTGITRGFPFGGFAGARPNSTAGGGPNLQPERTQGIEIGLEAAVLNSRISIDAVYYNQLSTDLINTIAVPGTTGFNFQTLNVGDMRNEGIELQLRAIPVKAGDFSWETAVNFTRNVNTVEKLELPGGVKEFALSGFSSGGYAMRTIAKEGEPFGLWQYTDYLRDPNGNLVVNPVNGLLQPATSDSTDTRNIQPDFNLGFINTFRYKNLSLSVNIQYQEGGTFHSGVFQELETPGKTRSTLYNNRQPWIVPGSVLDNGDGTYTTNTSVFIADPNQYWNNLGQQAYLLDATYIKLREVNLTYRLPSKWLEATPFSSASFSVIGRNLFLWTPEENQYSDPEQAQSQGLGTSQGGFQGFDLGQIPSTRSYGFSLRFTL